MSSSKNLKELNPKKRRRLETLIENGSDSLSIFLCNLDYLKNKKGWSLAKVAEEADISNGTLNSLYYKYCGSVQLYTIEQIAKGFGVSISEILDENMVERMEQEEILLKTYEQMSSNLETLEKSVANLRRTVHATIKVKETVKKGGMR